MLGLYTRSTVLGNLFEPASGDSGFLGDRDTNQEASDSSLVDTLSSFCNELVLTAKQLFSYTTTHTNGEAKYAASCTETTAANKISQANSTLEGHSELTKTSVLKNTLNIFRDIAVAIVGGLIVFAGLYFAIQTSALIGIPLILLGGYMMLRAYESLNEFRLLDTAKVQNAINIAHEKNDEILQEIIPAMETVNAIIAENTETGIKEAEEIETVLETVSEEIYAARRKAEEMMGELQRELGDMVAMRGYTEEAISKLKDLLGQIKNFEKEGQETSNTFDKILLETQALQDDPSKIEELKSKLVEMQKLQQKIKNIFDSIALIHSEMEIVLNGLEEVAKSYFYAAEGFEVDLIKKADSIKEILEKTGGDVSSVDPLINGIRVVFEQTLEAAMANQKLLEQTKACGHEIAQQLGIIQVELDQYKENLRKVEHICSAGAAVGAFLASAVTLMFECEVAAPIASATGGYLGGRVAFPLYRLSAQVDGFFQKISGIFANKPQANATDEEFIIAPIEDVEITALSDENARIAITSTVKSA